MEQANEAPEKIYRTTTYLNNKGWQTVWKKQPVAGAENIEYIRTDAFIEKASSWLKNNLQGIVGGSIYIEDFKNYMEGE